MVPIVLVYLLDHFDVYEQITHINNSFFHYIVAPSSLGSADHFEITGKVSTTKINEITNT